MSMLPFLPVLIFLSIGACHARLDYKGAEGLMQIQRVLELSAEIAKAEDVSISDDISTAESKYTAKRESYALPNDLFYLVNNHLQDLNNGHNNYVSYQGGQGSYVTPAPDIALNQNADAHSKHYDGIQFQRDEVNQQYSAPQAPQQQYTVSVDHSQHYASVPQQHQYVSPQDPQQNDVEQPDVQYRVPQAHSYVEYSGPPPLSGQQIPQVLTAQEHDYGQPQSSQYGTTGHQHYAIAAQQAAVVQQAPVQRKPQQQMYFVGGHPQSASYTEALIPATPQFVSNVAHQSGDPNIGKAPVQINIHPQAYGILSGYRGHISSQPDSYMPLQILINHLAEPIKLPPGISPIGGPEQPKMPVYHYSPVPSGTLKNEHVPEMRIKSTYTPPNPHSDKYKDYPSSSPQSSSSPQVPSPPSSSAWFSATEGSSSHPTSSGLPSPAQQPIDYDDNEFIKYDFGYRVSDEEHKVEFGKTESKKDGVTKGSYHVLLPDGRLQVVKYWSDHTGYHTNISYSVPGVDDKA